MKKLLLLIISILFLSHIAYADITTVQPSGDISVATDGTVSVKGAHFTETAITYSNNPYSVSSTDVVITCDATSGATTINLPVATGTGRYLIIKKIDSSTNACIPTRAESDTIDGATSYSLTVQYAASALIDTASGIWSRTHVNQLAGDVTGVSTANSVHIVETIGATFDGGGSAIPINKIVYRHMDYPATINSWCVICDAAESTMVVDVLRLTYTPATLPSASMVGSGNHPTPTNYETEANVSGWTSTAIVADDVLAFKVTTGAATATWCTISLKITR